MSEDSSVRLLLDLTDDQATGQLVVDLDTFNAFSQSMDEQLQQLVDRWASAAAPAANRPIRRNR